jgi:hypothetical protein
MTASDDIDVGNVSKEEKRVEELQRSRRRPENLVVTLRRDSRGAGLTATLHPDVSSGAVMSSALTQSPYSEQGERLVHDGGLGEERKERNADRDLDEVPGYGRDRALDGDRIEADGRNLGPVQGEPLRPYRTISETGLNLIAPYRVGFSAVYFDYSNRDLEGEDHYEPSDVVIERLLEIGAGGIRHPVDADVGWFRLRRGHHGAYDDRRNYDWVHSDRVFKQCMDAGIYPVPVRHRDSSMTKAGYCASSAPPSGATA